MMVLAVLHGLRPNQKLKSILEGRTDLTHLWGSTLHAHNLFSIPFFPVSKRLPTFHSHCEHAAQVLHRLTYASYP